MTCFGRSDKCLCSEPKVWEVPWEVPLLLLWELLTPSVRRTKPWYLLPFALGPEWGVWCRPEFTPKPEAEPLKWSKQAYARNSWFFFFYVLWFCTCYRAKLTNTVFKTLCSIWLHSPSPAFSHLTIHPLSSPLCEIFPLPGLVYFTCHSKPGSNFDLLNDTLFHPHAKIKIKMMMIIISLTINC